MLLAQIEPSTASTAGPAPPPPKTVNEAVRQARMSLRLYREAAAAAALPPSTSTQDHDSAPTTPTIDKPPSSECDGDVSTSSTPPVRRSTSQTSTAAAAVSPSNVHSDTLLSPGSEQSGAGQQSGQADGPRCLIVELPLPSQRTGFWGRGAPSADTVSLLDEGDYPGGEAQRFRVVRGLVEGLLEGYESEFLGCLEDSADGVGLWSVGRDTTLVANVTNATVPTLVKLFDGGYGSRVTRTGHIVIAVNPQWTDADSVGQPWQWRLRRRAAEILNPGRWETLFCARVVRGSRGASGLLHRAWPHRWALYPTATADTRYVGGCVLATPDRPPAQLVLERLNEAKPDMQRKAKELGLDEPGWF